MQCQIIKFGMRFDDESQSTWKNRNGNRIENSNFRHFDYNKIISHYLKQLILIYLNSLNLIIF